MGLQDGVFSPAAGLPVKQRVTGRSIKMRWYVSGSRGELEVVANDEMEARRKHMILKYGDKPDAVTPHAPHYKGEGLIVRRLN
jgi:hypothetical protein